jgi:hypothetical protein
MLLLITIYVFSFIKTQILISFCKLYIKRWWNIIKNDGASKLHAKKININ